MCDRHICRCIRGTLWRHSLAWNQRNQLLWDRKKNMTVNNICRRQFCVNFARACVLCSVNSLVWGYPFRWPHTHPRCSWIFSPLRRRQKCFLGEKILAGQRKVRQTRRARHSNQVQQVGRHLRVNAPLTLLWLKYRLPSGHFLPSTRHLKYWYAPPARWPLCGSVGVRVVQSVTLFIPPTTITTITDKIIAKIWTSFPIW